MPVLLHAVALIAAWWAGRGLATEARPRRGAARLALLAVAATWVLPFAATWLRTGAESWGSHGVRAIAGSAEGLLVGTSFAAWIVGAATLAVLLPRDTARPRERPEEAASRRPGRLAAPFAACVCLAEISILLVLSRSASGGTAPRVHWTLLLVLVSLATAAACSAGFWLQPRRAWAVAALAGCALALSMVHRGNDPIFDLDRFLPSLLAGVVWIGLRPGMAEGGRPTAALFAGGWLLLALVQPLFIDPGSTGTTEPIPYIAALPHLTIRTLLDAPDLEQALGFLVTPWAVGVFLLAGVSLVGTLGWLRGWGKGLAGTALLLFLGGVLYPILYMLLIGRLGGASATPAQPGWRAAMGASQETYAAYVLALVALASVLHAPSEWPPSPPVSPPA